MSWLEHSLLIAATMVDSGDPMVCESRLQRLDSPKPATGEGAQAHFGKGLWQLRLANSLSTRCYDGS
jgi:hypothetical protein